MQQSGFKVGTVLGIEIWLDYSWLILFFLIGALFTFGILPTQFPRLSQLARIVAGIIATLLFFGSVLLHELSHSLYAKSQGLKIRRITLFIFGGASELIDEPKSPRQEIILAGVGPLTSLGLSALFGIVLLLGRQLSYVPLIAIGSSLAAINLTLAIFNLLPGFPLDGGRVFRGIIWKITGNLEKATRTATQVGKILAIMLIGYGLVEVLLAGLFGGLWLIFIGFFLYQAAAASYEQIMSRLLLQDKTVNDLMERRFVAAPRHMLVRDFLQEYVVRYQDPIVLVRADTSHAAGLVDARQLPKSALDTPIGEFAYSGAILHPQDSAVHALDALTRSRLSKLPVTKNRELVGVLTVNRIKTYVLGTARLRATGNHT